MIRFTHQQKVFIERSIQKVKISRKIKQNCINDPIKIDYNVFGIHKWFCCDQNETSFCEKSILILKIPIQYSFFIQYKAKSPLFDYQQIHVQKSWMVAILNLIFDNVDKDHLQISEMMIDDSFINFSEQHKIQIFILLYAIYSLVSK